MGRALRLRPRPTVLLGLAGALAVLTAARLAWDAHLGTRLLLDHPSGTWATLADDLLHGVLVRPVVSDLGWGGTRYPPLHVVLHALLARASGALAGAGEALDALSLAALVLGVRRLLRRLGVGRGWAAAAALLGCALVPVQTVLGLVKADLLAAALNVWGLAFAAREDRRGAGIAGVLFGLAFLTKTSVLFGLAAAVSCAWASGRRRDAAALAGVAAATGGAGWVATQVASHGRAGAQFLACAAGGSGWTDILLAPVHFIAHSDPTDLVWVALAAGCWAAAPPASWRRLPWLAFGWTFLGTLALFVSPGVAENHLIDLDVSALVALAVAIHSGILPAAFGSVAAGLLALVCSARVVDDVTEAWRTIPPGALVAELGPASGGPLLAENPWVPLLAGERPVLLDAFLFRILARSRPELMSGLQRDLAARRFRAVVLRKPTSKGHQTDWYDELQFGPGFVEALTASYELVAVHRTGPRPDWGHYIWRPRQQLPWGER